MHGAVVLEPNRSPTDLRCREIGVADLKAVVDLLTRGFHGRRRAYWVRALDRLTQHATPAGLPKFGYLLEHGGRPVGVVLLLFSALPARAGTAVRCNVSSWYVDPQYRGYASLLIRRALSRKNVTYLNVSPALRTRATIEAQGFRRYCNGQLLAAPVLSRKSAHSVISPLRSVARPEEPEWAAEFDLLLAHEELGCVCLWCTCEDQVFPFAFLPRRIKGRIAVAQLVYCPSLQDFVRHAGAIGRFLARSGWFFVLLDASGPINGLPGRYFPGRGPKYFKGPEPPRLGDLAFTEAVLFGP